MYFEVPLTVGNDFIRLALLLSRLPQGFGSVLRMPTHDVKIRCISRVQTVSKMKLWYLSWDSHIPRSFKLVHQLDLGQKPTGDFSGLISENL